MTLNLKSNMSDVIFRAKELGITTIIHEGVTISVKTRMSVKTKADLLNAIESKKQPQIEEKEPQMIETEVTEVTEINEELELPSTSEAVEEMKTKIKDSITEMINAENNNDLDRQFSLMGSVIPNIVNHLINLSDSSYVITKTRSQIFAEIEREYELIDNKYKARYQRFCKFIRDGVYNSEAVKKHVKANSIRTDNQIKERRGNKVLIDPSKAIIKAVEVLQNIPKHTPARWREVCQAIKLLTGRRTSEILSSAKFIPAKNKGCLFFKGQLKKHSRDKFKSNEALLIPVLGGHTDLVLQGLIWLDSANKRIKPVDDSWESQIEANKIVNKKLSMYLTDYCKDQWYKLIESKNNQDWSDKKKPDCSRDIYTQIIGCAYQELTKDMDKTRQILINILGHEGDKAVVNYNVDFLVDYTDIQRFTKDIELKALKWD